MITDLSIPSGRRLLRPHRLVDGRMRPPAIGRCRSEGTTVEKTGWKACTISGDMSSSSAAENYPMVNVCPDCYAQDQRRGEDAIIVSVQGDYDADLGSECGLGCGDDADAE